MNNISCKLVERKKVISSILLFLFMAQTVVVSAEQVYSLKASMQYVGTQQTMSSNDVIVKQTRSNTSDRSIQSIERKESTSDREEPFVFNQSVVKKGAFDFEKLRQGLANELRKRNVIEAKTMASKEDVTKTINLLVGKKEQLNTKIDQLEKGMKKDVVLASADDDLSYLESSVPSDLENELAEEEEAFGSNDELVTVTSEADFMGALEEEQGVVNEGEQAIDTDEVLFADAGEPVAQDIEEDLEQEQLPNESAPIESDEDIDIDLEAKGPQTPEFSSFESVSADKMVNPYTGDLTYSLPVLEVPGAHNGGYAVALAYHSGSGPNDEASWVGHGWNLNPGVINRIKKGFPDDIKKRDVEYINDTEPNNTISFAPSLGVEAFSLNASFTKKYSYNNFKGFSGGYSIGLSAGSLGLAWTMEDGKGSFSPHVNVFRLLGGAKSILKLDNKNKEAPSNWARVAKHSIQSADKFLGQLNGGLFNYGITLLSDQGGASNVTEFTGTSESFDAGMATDIPFLVTGISGSVKGTRTIQRPVAYKTRQAYGYLYSDKTYQSTNSAENPGNNDIMDYHVEKNGTYSKRDNYLPIPFADVDVYNVSSEGISGGFRAFWNKPTMMFPPGAQSSSTHSYKHVQGHIGTTVGAGWSKSSGHTNIQNSHNWADNANTDDFKAKIDRIDFPNATVAIHEDEPYQFRFFSDMGGSVILDDYFGAMSMSTTPSIGTGGAANYKQKTGHTLEGKGRVGRKTFIDYHTNEYLNNQASSTSPMRTFEGAYSGSSSQYASYIDRSDPSIAEHIGEFSITNPNGVNYVYALPVYNRYEKSISYNIDENNILPGTPSTPLIADINYSIQANPRKIGERHQYAYPAYYLLTSIRSDNYADLNNNYLLDEDDLGGYTKFTYNQVYGSTIKNLGANWYNWRTPFTGLNYNQGKLSSNKDNYGSYASGEKEMYNVKTIETKTHIAVFVTNKSTTFNFNGVNLPNTAGTGDDRLDGLSANLNEFGVAKGEPQATGQVTRTPEFLEKIILFAKPVDASGATASSYKVLKTVRFAYDYSIWPNSPGVLQTTAVPNAGKLTLKKVWVEDEEVKNARVSPYKFDYTYSTTNTPYPSRYSNLATFYNGKNQTPDYLTENGNNVDAWGEYMDNGFVNRSELRPFTPQNPSATFDPSAWQLKQIKVPTGATIQVQYEQDDYSYVQDKKANVLMPLSSSSNDADNIYSIDLQSLYPGITTAEGTAYAQMLNNYFDANNPYIYFKFLYKLRADAPASSNLPLTKDNCNNEYISGYVKYGHAQWTNGKLQIVLVNASSPNPPTTANIAFPTNNYKFPKNVCLDFYKTETGYQAGECVPVMDFGSSLMGMANNFNYLMVQQMKNYVGRSTICGAINTELSYFKLPIDPRIMTKRGGGLRVKRLLRYDKGLQASGDDKALYGVEYTYNISPTSELSSGVAANEPPEMREENALVDFLQKRQSQKWYQKALAGVDREQFEGPYGESALPPASVGYSAVQIKNIHTATLAKTDDGINVYEYYTAKDYPYDAPAAFLANRPFFYNSRKWEYDKTKFYLGLFRHEVRSDHRAAQSYYQVIYNIAGNPKSESKYMGTDLSIPPVYQKIYSYYEPGEKIPLQTEVVSNVKENNYLGVNMEIVAERKRTITRHLSKDFNLDFGLPLLWPPIPPSGGAILWKTENNGDLSTLVANKTTYLPVVLKSVEEIKNGINNKSDNITFNKYSGSAVVVKTFDDFQSPLNNGTIPAEYYAYSQPAHMHYPNFNQKAFNQNKQILVGGTVSTGGVLTFNANTDHLVVGDLLELYKASGQVEDRVYITNKNSAASFDVERYDGTISASIPFVFAKVIKSGYTNNADQIVGNMVTYGKIPSNFSGPSTLTGAYLTNLFNTSGFSTTSGVQINLGQFGNIMQSTWTCSPSYCSNTDLIYESYIPTSAPTELYLIKYNPLNCYSVTGPMTIDPLILSSPDYDYMSAGLAGASLPKGVLGFIHLGQVGGTFTCSLSGSNFTCNYQGTGSESSFNEELFDAGNLLSNVISLQSSTFKHDWDYTKLTDYKALPGVALSNNFSRNKLGSWGIEDSYMYKKDRDKAYTDPAARNYNSGMFEYAYLGWNDHTTDPSWVLKSKVLNYSPHGEVIDEEDAIEVPSSVHYTVGKTMPGVVASNAKHNSVFFESFEDMTSLAAVQAKYSGVYGFAPNYGIDVNFASSGKNTLELKKSTGYVEIPYESTDDYDNSNNNILVRYWCSTWPTFDEAANGAIVPNDGCNIEFRTNGSLTSTHNPTKIATVGSWCLFEVVIPGLYYNPSNTDVYTMRIKPVNKDVFIDDIRYQPMESTMKAYVYDARRKRLLAELNDDHMPIKYVYNKEGKLVRRIVWTEKGAKVIEEKYKNSGFKETRPQ